MNKGDWLNYIQEILNHSEGEYYIRGKPVHKINNLYVNLWRDNDTYLNGLQYIKENDTFWHWSSHEKFVNNHLSDSNMLKVNVAKRLYGQPKLDKPKELKGVKQAFSVDYIPKRARCQIYIVDNDIWIKHVDWFSSSMTLPEDEIGAPLEYVANKYLDKQRGKKFTYGDAWGSIVLRNEAWIHIQGLLYRLKLGEFQLDLVNDILRQIERIERFDHYELVSTDMERFIENVVMELKNYIKEESQ